MLAELFINNFVIIKRDHLFFDKGFNVFTGETGSGKSLILDAINIVLGKRANKDVIGKFDDKTIIEAVFVVDKENKLAHVEYLEQNTELPDYKAALEAAKKLV